MANNYTPSYNQYRTQTAGYALPSSVRTYSVFDPASNSWRRMTNDVMSPMPQGNQPDIQAALAQARQTQGIVYPAQGMGQGQPVEMHPGYLNPPAQTSAQMPSGGSVRPSPASGGEGASVSLSPVSGTPQRASQRGFKASGPLDGYLSTGLSTTAYPEGYRAVVSPDNQVPTYTIDRNGVAVPNVSGIPLPEQVIRENVRKATNSNLPNAKLKEEEEKLEASDNFRYGRPVEFHLPMFSTEENDEQKFRYGRPVGFLGHVPKGTDINGTYIVDPSEGTISYTNEMTDLGKAINQDPETRQYIAPVWGTAVSVGLPVSKVLGLGAGFLRGTKLANTLNSGFTAGANNATKIFKPLINKVYNSQKAQQAIVRNDPWKIIREYTSTHPSAGTVPGTNIARGLRTGANAPSVTPSIWANARNIR